MNEFEKLLQEKLIPLQRYVNFKIADRHDAEDVIQDVCLCAALKFDTLSDHAFFKAWLIGIAKHKCTDYYRLKAASSEVPLDSLSESALGAAGIGITEHSAVRDTLDALGGKEKQILYLYFFEDLSQEDISKRLDIPVGTVKSRLHYAKNQFRSVCTPEQILMFEKGRKIMPKKDDTRGFSENVPTLVIKKSSRPFFEVKCADESFIVPVIGNKNAEGTYRYPSGKLALVSSCYVPKAAVIHGVEGVKICRDTYNVKAGKLYKNECIWFSQLTDEYVRDLATVACDSDADDDYPTAIHTFLEEDYDVKVNGNDRVHGRPLLIKENPPEVVDGKIVVNEYNVRYTMGTFDVTVGERAFETVKFINVQNGTLVTENYVDANGRLVLMRWYESVASVEQTEWYTDEWKNAIINENPRLTVNDVEYCLLEDRISEYAL